MLCYNIGSLFYEKEQSKSNMDETQVDAINRVPTIAGSQEQETSRIYTYADYHSIITGAERRWDYGGFALPDGSFWRYREPDAVVIVEGQRLRVRTGKITRFNDKIQILDNAKNML